MFAELYGAALGLEPGPPAPEARIMPLDQAAGAQTRPQVRVLLWNPKSGLAKLIDVAWLKLMLGMDNS